jgi:peptide/nickel transport system substrate-binding protein
MHLDSIIKRATGLVLALGLLFVLACGSSDEAAAPAAKKAAPTATPTTQLAVPVMKIPTATSTPVPPKPGVTVAAKPKATNTPVPTGPKPIYGGTTSIGEDGVGGNAADPVSGQAGYGWSGLGLIGNLWSQVLRFSLADKQTVAVDLAESWSMDADGKTYRFKIRTGIKDHEGNAFNAHDVAYSIYRMIERPNKLSSKRQGCLRAYVNPVNDENGKKRADAGVEATSDTELVIRLAAPRTAFVACFVSPWTAILPDTYTKAIDDSGEYRELAYDSELIGTGAFMALKVEPDNMMQMERNPNYFLSEYPYLDGYTMYAIPDANTRVAAFLSGKVDYLGLFGDAASPADVARITKQLGADKVRAPAVNANGWRGFPLNVMKAPFGPIGDPKADDLRDAIQWAANREEFNKLGFNGTGHTATPYFIGWEWIYTKDQWFKEYRGFDSSADVKAKDLADAQALMTKHGYSKSNPLKVHFVCATGNRKDCEIFDQQLERIWIEADLQLAPDYGSADAAGKSGDFQIIQISKGLSFQDPDGYNVSTYLLHTEGGRNYSGYVNPEWRKLMESQLTMNDQAERAVVLRKMARMFHDDANMIGMVRPGVVGLHRATWQNWTPPIVHTDAYSLERVWLSK